jgi:hypothetical protein
VLDLVVVKMSKKALVKSETGETENVIVVGEDYEPPEGYELKDPADAPPKPDAPEPPEPVDRSKVSQASKDALKQARQNGDTQKEIDILYDIVTGEALE